MALRREKGEQLVTMQAEIYRLTTARTALDEQLAVRSGLRIAHLQTHWTYGGVHTQHVTILPKLMEKY